MSFDSNLKLLGFVAESTPGTRVDLTYPTDLDVRLFDVGDASYDIPKEPIGELADGTFKEGPALSRERKINLPDFKTEFLWSGAITTEPNFWKFLKACGMYSELNGANPELVWDGTVDCSSLSADLTMFSCGATPTGVRDKARGVVGNVEIGADGPQAPITCSFTSMMGAFLGKVDVPAAAKPALTGLDTTTVEQMGNYVATIGGVTYAVQAWNFNTNNEINAEGANNSEGIARMKITNQGARLTMTVTLLDIASDDPLSDMFDNSVLSTVVLTGNASAHYTITFSTAEYVEVQPSDSSGTASYDLTFKVDEARFVQKA